jgi:hypothetical protein
VLQQLQLQVKPLFQREQMRPVGMLQLLRQLLVLT